MSKTGHFPFQIFFMQKNQEKLTNKQTNKQKTRNKKMQWFPLGL